MIDGDGALCARRRRPRSLDSGFAARDAISTSIAILDSNGQYTRYLFLRMGGALRGRAPPSHDADFRKCIRFSSFNRLEKIRAVCLRTAMAKVPALGPMFFSYERSETMA